MTEWFCYLVENHPMLATLLTIGGLAFAFWFLMIYDFPERLLMKLSKKKNDENDEHGYNIFD